MTKNDVIDLVFAELRHAETKHPGFPKDVIHAAAIVAEESGELIQAAIDHVYKGDHTDQMIKEAAQTAAVAMRFLLNLVDRPCIACLASGRVGDMDGLGSSSECPECNGTGRMAIS